MRRATCQVKRRASHTNARRAIRQLTLKVGGRVTRKATRHVKRRATHQVALKVVQILRLELPLK